MRVAILTPVFWPVGAICYPNYMARALKTSGHDVVVQTMDITPAGKKINAPNEWDGIKIYRFPTWGSLGEFAKVWFPITNGFDIIHCCGGYRHPHTAYAFIRKRHSSKFVFSPFFPEKPRENKLQKMMIPFIDRTFGRYILKNSDLVLAETNLEREWLNSLGVKNSEVLPNPLPEIAFDNYNQKVFRDKYKIGTKKIIFFLGGHSYIKNVEMLIKTMPINDAMLVLGGEGELTKKYKKFAKELGIEKHIIYPGSFFNDYKGKMEAFSSADVVVLPSLHEGLGTVLLEAMAQEKPILASNVGGLPDVVPDSYCLFDPKDTVGLHMKLKTILYDKNLAKKIAKKGKRKADGYRFTSVSQKYITLLNRLLSTRGSIENG